MQNKLDNLGITLRKTGRQVCPKCSHTRKNKTDKCLQVTYKDDCVLYNCHNFGCGFTGIVSDKKYNFEIQPKVYKKPLPAKEVSDKEKVYKYFESRGIKRETTQLFNIGYNGSEIIFPYYKHGELVNNKYRTANKTFRQEAESEKTLFGMDICTNLVADTEDYTLTIVEGEFDAMSFIQAGIPAVSIPQGASDNKLECISNCFDFISAFDNIVIAVDADKAGDNIKEVLLERFNKSKACYVIDWSKYDSKDANDALIKGGIDLLQKAYSEREHVPIKGLVNLELQRESIRKFIFSDYNKGLSTGWSNLDNIINVVEDGALAVVTGYPGRGKSTFVDNLLYNLSVNENWKHLVCSFETTVERHVANFIQMHTGKSAKTQGDYAIKEDEFNDSIDYFSNKLFLYDTDESLSIDDIIELAKYAVERYGVKSLTIDPYNRIKRNIGDREDLFIGEMLAKLAFFAKQYGILVIFIAHPKKTFDTSVIPTGYDISGSADWVNMADYLLSVHRDKNKDTGRYIGNTILQVQKVKSEHHGDPSGGTVEFNMFRNRLKEI